MRMMFPGLRERRIVDRQLTAFFREQREIDFRRGIAILSRFYDLPCPRVLWFEYLDWGKTAGRTYENGNIHLVHPENWKRGRKYNSERQWVHTVYHEFGHYVLWADAERKADGFAYRFVRGVSAHGRTATGDRPVAAVASRPRRKRAALLRRPRPRQRPRRSRSR
ncbi:MAG TPA: hypothetical protein VKA21_01255 [Candidatus Binatia bacterium]|nr:hypothetical protein [Candidatus Binatia bacterium]